jgi:predicted nucleotidyltransferase
MINLEETRNFLRKKANSEATKNIQMWQKAYAEAELIIERIIREINPREIWQWGSIVQKEKFRDYSDIDIGLCGLGGFEELSKAQKIAMEIATFPIDLVELDKLEDNFQIAIKRRGKKVYERR